MSELLLTDEPADHVRRFTLNRPDKRNALNRPLRVALLSALRAGDADDDVRVMVVRGAGSCFSAGYDLAGEGPDPVDPVDHVAGGLASFPREVTEGWMSIWDLGTPVIAQVHGYCLAGATELATGCDLVYVAEDARIGYPAVRFGTPDMQWQPWLLGMRRAMEFMLTGDALTGTEAVEAGFANRAFAEADLAAGVLEVARRIATTPTDIVQLNKRTVHRAMANMGMRESIRSGTEMTWLATFTDGFQAFLDQARSRGLTSALQERDEPFGDYRTTT